MLLYRGDKYVTGKKFKIKESVYTFIKRDKDDNLIFESVKNGKKLKLTEAEVEEENETPYYVEVWYTEEDRDEGYGEIYDRYETRDEAIKAARKIWDDGDVASVEACYEDKDGCGWAIVCGADGEFTFYDEDLKANK